MSGLDASRGRRDPARFDGWWCGLAVVAATLSALPFSDVGFIDDWSYLRTAEFVARTGHPVYNGWAAMPLGWQLWLGALFLRVFGDSFTSARMSTLVVAFLTIVLFERLLAGFGLTRRNAVFGALMLGLSPLFLPLAASFMTDTNAVFVLVLCGWLCLRALRAQGDRAVCGWLAAAALADAMGGTVRQTAWLPGLLLIPATAWLLRGRRGVVPLAAGLWCGVVAAMAACLTWWSRQPYAVDDPAVDWSGWRLAGAGAGLLHFGFSAIFTCLCLALCLFPLLAAWLVGSRGRWGWLAAIGVLTLAAGRFSWLRAPWLEGVVWTVGPASRGNSDITTDWVYSACGAVVSVAVIVSAAALAVWLARRRGALSREMLVVLVFAGPYLLGYGALVLTRIASFKIYDRYLLGALPLVILCLLRLCQDGSEQQDETEQDGVGRARLPGLSYLVLAGMTVFTVLGTHDWFASLGAMEQAEQGLVARGVARTKISAGPELEGMTQLEVRGYVNERRIRVPAGAFDPNARGGQIPEACRTWLTPQASALVPEYVIRVGTVPCVPGAQVAVSEYATWMPPFRRALYVLRLRPAEGER